MDELSLSPFTEENQQSWTFEPLIKPLSESISGFGFLKTRHKNNLWSPDKMIHVWQDWQEPLPQPYPTSLGMWKDLKEMKNIAVAAAAAMGECVTCGSWVK